MYLGAGSDISLGIEMFLTEPIADSLRNARRAKGLSQRDLSVNSAVPQGHISKIENGAVDLRVSSLVTLARALDLELMLVPRRSVAAVRSIAGSGVGGAARDGKAVRQVQQELSRLQDPMDRLPGRLSSGTDLEELQRLVRDLRRFRPTLLDLPTVRQATRAVNALLRDPGVLDAVRRSSSRLRRLRDALAQGRMARDEGPSVRPAYSLDENEDG